MTDAILYGPNIPIVDPATGLPTREEIRFRNSLWMRTGGPEDFILGLQTDLGDATAQALFRATSATTSAGAVATIALQVRASTVDTFHTASIKLSAMALGLSRVEIAADEITIDGTLLVNGALLTGHLAPNAATLPGDKSGTGTVAAGAASAWTLIDSFTDTFTAHPVSIDIGLDLDNTDAGDHTFNVALTYDSTDPTVGTPPLYNASRSYLIAKSPAWFPFSKPVAHTPGSGSHTYRLYFNADSTAVRARIWDLKYAEIRR